MIGIALASPVMLYELWAFVSPGLTPHERRMARPWIPLALVFLVLGIARGLPDPAVRRSASCLASRSPASLEPLITAESYFGFVTTMFLAFGLVMQFPIVLVLLSRWASSASSGCGAAGATSFVGIFIFAVVVTPGGDPISPVIMAVVMYPLYELTIWLVGRSDRGAVEGAEWREQTTHMSDARHGHEPPTSRSSAACRARARPPPASCSKTSATA